MLSAPTLAASGEKMLKNMKMVMSESKSGIDLLENDIVNDSGNLSAWLLKRKSGTKSRFLSTTNRRFFILDFGSQILFYKHSETDKKISQPISFRSIVSVQSLTDTVTDVVDDAAETQNPVEEGVPNEPRVQRADSKTSLASSLRKRMPSFSKISTPRSRQPPKERHGFVVGTRDKSLELLCSSKMEADQWITALHKAMLLGGPKMVENSCPDLAQSLESSTIGSSRPTTACSYSSTLANSNCSEASEPFASSPAALTNPAQEYVSKSGMPPKVPKRPPVAKPRSPKKQAVTTPTNEVGLTESSDGVAEYLTVDARLEDDNSAWGVTQLQNSKEAVPRYFDRAEGLSWQERLERLNFSDDEEDDDSEKNQAQEGLPITGMSNGVAETAAMKSEPVEVDYCQPFTADLSDSDEE